MKKSFILHFDALEILDELTDEQCGLLFKACRDFNLGLEPKLDSVLSLVFFSFKKQFERDRIKYQNVVDRNKTNGSKGGRPKANPNEPKKPNGLNENPGEAKKADNDNDNDNDNEKIKTEYTAFANDLWYTLLINNPKLRKPNLNTWANDVRLAVERDSRTIQELKTVFMWANQHSFWASNILSPKKLRDQFDAMNAQKNQEEKNANSKPNNQKSIRQRLQDAR